VRVSYSSHVDLAGLPSRIAAKVKASYAIGSQLGAPISDRAQTAFVSGMPVALLTAAGPAIVAAIGALLLLARGALRNTSDHSPNVAHVSEAPSAAQIA
jgi:hypothetical protein